MATRLTKNFTLEELTASNTAKRYKINNTPNEKELAQLKRLAEEVLQPIRDKFCSPITINCAFRCAAVNVKVGGSKTSQHLKGEAADIEATNKTNRELFYVIYDMIQRGELKVGQLIWEFGNDKEPDWVHVSLPYTKVNNILQAKKINGVTKYIPFKK